MHTTPSIMLVPRERSTGQDLTRLTKITPMVIRTNPTLKGANWSMKADLLIGPEMAKVKEVVKSEL
jgi:hypothetical protein